MRLIVFFFFFFFLFFIEHYLIFQVQISAYLDNVFDVAALMEDSETKTAALEKVAELEDELGHVSDIKLSFYVITSSVQKISYFNIYLFIYLFIYLLFDTGAWSDGRIGARIVGEIGRARDGIRRVESGIRRRSRST